ncbi:hypothetical protein EYF80_061192 [Liparis tanakae]|uniref:Uncharacterized protein n=1 Tax=Liparis tanakae TaxID=230148 RepID=A0A4Z2EJA5_9TELE|nr:hypothetical protein EYF80_061192 [Liparis tanakae]
MTSAVVSQPRHPAPGTASPLWNTSDTFRSSAESDDRTEIWWPAWGEVTEEASSKLRPRRCVCCVQVPDYGNESAFTLERNKRVPTTKKHTI